VLYIVEIREMRRRRRCGVKTIEFQCASPAVPERDDIRSVVVNVDLSEASP
jgi:hypothetical protein